MGTRNKAQNMNILRAQQVQNQAHSREVNRIDVVRFRRSVVKGVSPHCGSCNAVTDVTEERDDKAGAWIIATSSEYVAHWLTE
jgi:hypothetical protein